MLLTVDSHCLTQNPKSNRVLIIDLQFLLAVLIASLSSVFID